MDGDCRICPADELGRCRQIVGDRDDVPGSGDSRGNAVAKRRAGRRRPGPQARRTARAAHSADTLTVASAPDDEPVLQLDAEPRRLRSAR